MNRHLLLSWARLHRRAVEPARSAGSVMLLVVGVLLLVLIIGMTYMHVVQEDRRAGLTVDIDAIVLAQIDLINAKLLEDLAISATGQHFADNDSDGFPDQEPYDYPGDEDKWLAASYADFSSDEFSQVTLLGEAFWDGAASSDTTRTLTVADAGTSKASGVPADSTGNGIRDAKPEEAAIATRGGLVFFAWSRVVDLSGKPNINVWHTLSNSSDAYSAAEAPRWTSPGELNLGEMISYYAGNYPSAWTDTRALFDLRFGTAPGVAPELIPHATRQNSWQNSGRYYENPQGAYKSLHVASSGDADFTNEMELRYREGLIYLENEAEVEEAGNFRTILRGNKTSAETSWDAAGGPPGMTASAPDLYFPREPRNNFTTYSGASIFRMPMGADGTTTSTTFYGKRDLNELISNVSTADIAAEVLAVYASNTPTLPNGSASATVFADQMAASIVDYADTDNILTAHGTRYGFEALPFITEAYSHVPYEIVAVTGGPAAWNCTFAFREPAYAIEIRNPSIHPVELANVRILANGAVWGTLDVLAAGATGLPGDGKLPADRPLILYRDGPSAHGSMAALIDNSQTPITKAIASAWPRHAAGSAEITIALEVLDSNGSWVTYQKFKQTVYNLAATGPRVSNDVADPTGKYFIQQTWSRGNGNGINMMTVDESECAYEKTAPIYDSINTLKDYLGVPGKGLGSPADLVVAPTLEQLIFNNTGEMSHIGEILHVAALGPTSTLTIAEVWGNATSIDDFRPDPASASKVLTGAGSADYQVPHAVLLMDRLTLLSPREDSIDNDGDGSPDEADEVFTPGTLNINTSTDFLLKRVLPMGDPDVRQAYIDAILAYRDTPGTTHRTGANYRANRKGIAYIGELYNLSSMNAIYDFGANGVSDYNGASFGNLQGDYLSNPTTGDDGMIDDREEKTLLPRWFSQVCSTRSDTYIAYVLVRGYSPGNLTTPVTERRAAVLLDRSRVTTQDDGVRILGIVWY